jgi:uncharacterized protein
MEMESVPKPETAPLHPSKADLATRFAAFVADPAFPCLGAKAALNAGTYMLSVYDCLASHRSSLELAEDLRRFVGSDMLRRSDYATFIAVFHEPSSSSEEIFEALLWSQLQRLANLEKAGQRWDSAVASDPADPHFAFSFGGQALYVVGMHSGSSRLARRFPWPVLVFNPHAQFERLRHDGKWERMRESIRTRDISLQGSVNPMLTDFGEVSESRQYSGRAVEENWEAPFHASRSEAAEKRASRCPFARD